MVYHSRIAKRGRASPIEPFGYDKDQESETVPKWREAWAKKSQYLRQEEEGLKPMGLPHEAGSKWQEAWGHLLHISGN